jgi:hypothetical protein
VEKTKKRSEWCPGCRKPWDHYPCTRERCGQPEEIYQEEVRRRRELRETASAKEIETRDERKTAYQEHFKALEEHAFRRTKTAVKWLLDFVSLNLDALSEVEWRKQRYSIASFTQLGIVQYAPTTAFGWIPGAGSFRTTTLPWNCDNKTAAELTPAQDIEQRRLPLPETVKALQREIRKQLNQWNNSRRITCPQPRGKLTLIFHKKSGQVLEHFVPSMSQHDTPENLFLYRCSRLFSGRLRCCPNEGCGKWFLAGREDQRSCSSVCRSRSHNRRERGTPPERFFKLGRPRETHDSEGKV